MTAPRTLMTDDEIHRGLEILPNWQWVDGALQREHQCKTYLNGLALVQGVGLLAEDADHHPDMTLAYTRLTIRLSTHQPKGITPLDFDLANKIEYLIEQKDP